MVDTKVEILVATVHAAVDALSMLGADAESDEADRSGGSPDTSAG